MINLQILAASLAWGLISSTFLLAGDLSRYRQFELDSTLSDIAKQGGMKLDDATTVHERPALIQELSWRTSSQDAVKEILFSFCDGELFRMRVDYDRYTTKGLTAQDVIEAISAVYGEVQRPSAEITLSTTYGSTETVDVIARWEDTEWSFNLVRFEREPNFTLAVLSKRLDGVARTAITQAIRLAEEEAPQRRIDQQSKDALAKAAEQEEARKANKLSFRP